MADTLIAFSSTASSISPPHARPISIEPVDRRSGAGFLRAEFGALRVRRDVTAQGSSPAQLVHTSGVRRRRSWTALSAEIDVISEGKPLLRERGRDCTTFMVLLEEVGGRIQIGTEAQSPQYPNTANAMYFAPMGSTLKVSGEQVSYAKLMAIELPEDAVETLFAAERRPTLPNEVRLNFFDARLLGLARLFEAECEADGPSDLLYGDSLSIGLISLLERLKVVAPKPRYCGGLTSRQLRLVTDFMKSNFREAISLRELAEIARLSPSYFCRMFKETTGVPPHQWLNRLRIGRAKSMLLDGEPLAQVALETGFSDQPHLTRVFNRIEGVSPGIWRRQHAC